MAQFTLSITLGNDAMQTNEDIADALYDVAEDVALATSGKVFDRNGNQVGNWRIS